MKPSKCVMMTYHNSQHAIAVHARKTSLKQWRPQSRNNLSHACMFFFVGFMTHCGFGYSPFRYIYMGIYIHIHCKYMYIYNIYQQPIFHNISTVKVSSNSALAPDIGVFETRRAERRAPMGPSFVAPFVMAPKSRSRRGPDWMEKMDG